MRLTMLLSEAARLAEGMFDFPGVLLQQIVDWAEGEIEKIWGKPWKKFEKKFPLTVAALGDWRYLDRMKEDPEALDAVLKRLKVLHVVFKNDSGGKGSLGAGGSYAVAGNKITINTSSYPDGNSWSSTLRHELRHFCQYLMQEVLRARGIHAKPGRPSPSMWDDVRQSRRGRPANRIASHALDDDEFYTKLGSEIDFWLDLEEDEEYKELPKNIKIMAMRWYTKVDRGRVNPQIPDWLIRRLSSKTLTSIFNTFHDNQEKWKKAVKIFFGKVL